MKSLNRGLQHLVILFLVLVMAVPFGMAESRLPLNSPGVGTSTPVGQGSANDGDLGGNGSVTGVQSAPVGAPPRNPAESSDQAQQNQQSPAPQNNQTKPDNSATAPVGTAAAPYEKQEGISASKPAGAAIAPGKQRRIRTYAIRVGLIVGAAIAIGVVAGASLGSSSRP